MFFGKHIYTFANTFANTYLNLRYYLLKMLRLLNTNTFRIAYPVIKMQSHHIVIPQFIPIWNRITNVDDHNQIIDFTENPLYKSNPTGINNYVNDLNSIVPYNVRMIINGLASTDREIYNLVNNSSIDIKNKIIADYKIDTLTPIDIASINSYIYKIAAETEKEHSKVSKFIFDYDMLINNVSNDITKNKFYTYVTSAICIYIDYKYITLPHSHDNVGLLDIIYYYSNLQYWCWILPAGFIARTYNLTNMRNKFKNLYSEYMKNNYIGKYQYKLDMLFKFNNVFSVK